MFAHYRQCGKLTNSNWAKKNFYFLLNISKKKLFLDQRMFTMMNEEEVL